jgi:hypothetical protein
MGIFQCFPRSKTLWQIGLNKSHYSLLYYPLLYSKMPHHTWNMNVSGDHSIDLARKDYCIDWDFWCWWCKLPSDPSEAKVDSLSILGACVNSSVNNRFVTRIIIVDCASKNSLNDDRRCLRFCSAAACCCLLLGRRTTQHTILILHTDVCI